MIIPEDIKNIICRKYSRPTKLSDPGSDFSQEELEAIIHKSDADLTDTDLICIFQSCLPAGEYWESIYFLPLALKHICTLHGDARNNHEQTQQYYILVGRRQDFQGISYRFF